MFPPFFDLTLPFSSSSCLWVMLRETFGSLNGFLGVLKSGVCLETGRSPEIRRTR